MLSDFVVQEARNSIDVLKAVSPEFPLLVPIASYVVGQNQSNREGAYLALNS